MDDGIRVGYRGRVVSKNVSHKKTKKEAEKAASHGRWCIDSRNGCPVEKPKKNQCQYPNCYNKIGKGRMCNYGCGRRLCIVHRTRCGTSNYKCPDCISLIFQAA